MSQADILKQLRVKTNAVKRINKELGYYVTDKDKQAERVQKMRDEGHDASDIRQAENVLAEAEMMVPQTKMRLEAALEDLRSFLADNSSDVGGTPEQTDAVELLEAVEQGAFS